MIVQLPVNSNGSNGALRALCGTQAVSAVEKTASSSHSKRVSGANNGIGVNKAVQEATAKTTKMADSAITTTASPTSTTPAVQVSSGGNGCSSSPAINSNTNLPTTVGSSNSATNSNSQNLTTQQNPQKSSSPSLSNIDEFGLTVGSVFSVQTCWDKHYEGEVMSFDYGSKILLLKCVATSGNPTRDDVHMVNLNYVKHLEKKKSGKKDVSGTGGLRGLKIQKVC